MLGELGANVFVVGRRENLLKESVKEIEAAGGKGAYLSADLEDGDSAANVAKEAIKAFGFFKGSLLAIKRVLRCNPWGGSGIDNVPGGCKHGRD